MPGLYLGDDSNRKDVANRFVNDVSSKNDPKAGEPAVVSPSPIPSSSLKLKHASNRHYPSDGFKNDFSSRATVEARKLQEALDLKVKLAAEDAAEAAAKKAQEEAQDLKRLRDLKLAQEMLIKDLTKKLMEATSNVAHLQAENKQLEIDNTDLNGKLNSEEDESKRYRRETNRLNDVVEDLRTQLEAKRDLDANNNLDPACHGRQAYIVHLQSRTAVDFGANNGSQCHGWGLDLNNDNQIARLYKVDSWNRFANWTLTVNNRYMEFQSAGNRQLALCSSRRSGDSARMQEWKIGRIGARGYVLENAYHGTALDIERSDECKDGQETTSFMGQGWYSQSDLWNSYHVSEAVAVRKG